MTEEQALSILEQLRNAELKEVEVTKEDFLLFRQHLTKQEDFLNYRGRARHGGHVIYTYEAGWTK